jgi:hypothetical protein
MGLLNPMKKGENSDIDPKGLPLGDRQRAIMLLKNLYFQFAMDLASTP